MIKLIDKKPNLINSVLCGVLSTLILTSCSMVNEDLDPCAPQNHLYTIVNFQYKYHMSNEYMSTEDDWFGDHAGSAYLYVFDEDGYYLFTKQKNKAFMSRRDIDFSISLDETELEPGKKYILAAMAQGNHAGYEASLATPGFTLLKEMVPHVSKIEDFRVKLDRDGDGYYDFGVTTDDYGVFNYKEDYKNNNLKLDTLWCTRPGYIEHLTLPYREYVPSATPLPNDTVNVTMQVMRVTNSIKVNLVCDAFGSDTDVDDYKFLIDFPKGNGTLGFTGDLDYQSSQELMYFTLRKKMAQYQEKKPGAQYDAEPVEDDNSSNKEENAETKSAKTRAAKYCVNAEFGVSRLQTADESFLQIINVQTGRTIAKLENMSDWLADYFDHRYDDQEFLDREYDYTIDVHIDDDGNMVSLQIGCSILGWGKRVQYVIMGQ